MAVERREEGAGEESGRIGKLTAEASREGRTGAYS